MIEPWQVWDADYEGTRNVNPVVIISSSFHLRLTVGRYAVVAPMTAVVPPHDPDYWMKIIDPRDGEQLWLMADRITVLTSVHLLNHAWTLSEDETTAARKALSHMVDL